MATQFTDFRNSAFSYLKKNVGTTDSQIFIHDARRFPPEPFWLRIGREIVRVDTVVDNETLNVTRAQSGTSALVHNSGHIVIMTLLEESVDRYLTDRILFAKTRPQLAKISDEDGVALKVADFTWLNQGTASATDVEGTILFDSFRSASVNVHGLTVTAPSTPWTMTVGYRPQLTNTLTGQGGYPQVNLILKNTGNARIITMVDKLRESSTNGEGARKISVELMTDSSTFSSFDLNEFQFPWNNTTQNISWLRITDTGTNLVYYISHDGKNWIQVRSASRTAWLTSGPNQIGFGMDPSGVDATESPIDPRCTFTHFSLT